MPQDVKRLAALFTGFASAHGTHGEPVQRESDGKWEIKQTAKTLKEPVTLDLWEQHVRGTRPLGVGPICEDSTCRWGSIDYDVYDADLLDLVARVEEMRLPLIPCRSKSGGLHLFMFLTEAIPAREVKAVLESMASQLGLGGSEIFPKQTSVMIERGDLPSWMVMPYFGDTFSGHLQEQVGLRRDGTTLTLRQFLAAAEAGAVSSETLANYRSSVNPVPAKRRPGGAPPAPPTGVGSFADGPTCLQHLAAGPKIGSGGNNMLLMMGVYFKRAFPDDWEGKLDEANRLYCDPPRASEEIQSLIKSLRKKEYEYTCSTEPMKSFCNTKLCRTRRFGVGAWGEYPEIGGMSCLRTDPVIWFVDVDGQRLEISTPDLVNYTKFHQICMERHQRCYRTMKQDTWLKLLHEKMDNVLPIEPPADAAPRAQFCEVLEEFLTDRHVGTRREDMHSGRPYLNDEKRQYEFRLRDLQRFLEKIPFMRELSRPMIVRELDRLGASYSFAVITGKGVNYWHIDASMFTATPRVSVPPIKDGEVM